MKQLFFAMALALSLTSAAAEQQCVKQSSNLYFGKVSQLVFKAMQSAGVKEKCDNRICTLTITDFESFEETDGCGGGTTGYGTAFTYADGKKYDLAYCTGEGAGLQEPKNVGAGLLTIFSELGLSKTAGWRSSIRLSKVECVASSKKGALGSVANCQVVFAQQYNLRGGNKVC